MYRIAQWILLAVVGVSVGFGGTLLVANHTRVIHALVAMLPAPTTPAELSAQAELTLLPEQSVTSGTGAAPAEEALPAVEPQTTSDTLSAVGVIALRRDRRVVLGAGGQVSQVDVAVGDRVQAGDLLLTLDTTYLDWAVEQAELAFLSARIDFEEAGALVDPADLAVAQANLLVAQETLTEVAAGPTVAGLAAVESAAVAAWARVQELQERPTPGQITQALANLKRAELAVQAAQREYDKIAWLPESAASSAADALQRATIDLEAAQIAFEEANKPATQAEILAATSTAQNAQAQLNDLRLKPTPAELAAAQARVAAAEAAWAEAQEGPDAAAVRQAELAVRQAMIRLEEARLAQAAAQVVAPTNGTVMAVNVELGQQVSSGAVAVRLADTADIELTVNVEQRDIAQVKVGTPVDIAIYALPGLTFTGVVDRIAPVAGAESSFVNFPVMIRFTDGPLARVLPGMTASATFLPSAAESSN